MNFINHLNDSEINGRIKYDRYMHQRLVYRFSILLFFSLSLFYRCPLHLLLIRCVKPLNPLSKASLLESRTKYEMSVNQRPVYSIHVYQRDNSFGRGNAGPSEPHLKRVVPHVLLCIFTGRESYQCCHLRYILGLVVLRSNIFSLRPFLVQVTLSGTIFFFFNC